jgi:hypothetical protein
VREANLGRAMASDRARGYGALLTLVLTAAVSAAACSTPTPTPDTTKVLHFENRTGTAVIVDITSHDLSGSSPAYSTAVRPCGGKLDLTAGVGGSPLSGWEVWLLIDPSGGFDASLANWTEDPHAMPGTYAAQILWSRGDVGTPDLPRWISITPAQVLMSSTPAAPSSGPSCGPIVRPSDLLDATLTPDALTTRRAGGAFLSLLDGLSALRSARAFTSTPRCGACRRRDPCRG